uniref:DUF2442 domain-containing protein n=1 Tax=Candidatus Kentrum sp. TUN TaxID=2126343 RepID=A0A450ZKS5_9GAMM|nr:MAG: Protein of unknown function (DUF2442) [Candidatus Kentron sp. TUN]VFK54863.1 MAG: Protein of unknown function (DUF2442) [Candidatus Kentron sp. TUN]VFK60168.1 MAG: Protein of unknown function (DUF2442) [Candidatus Kentron sp. TUN]
MYPSVKKVSTRNDYRIFIEFDNGECGTLDMAPYLNFGVFDRIRDPDLFRQVRVAFDTVEWANGIDLDPEFVYERSVKEKHPI